MNLARCQIAPSSGGGHLSRLQTAWLATPERSSDQTETSRYEDGLEDLPGRPVRPLRIDASPVALPLTNVALKRVEALVRRTLIRPQWRQLVRTKRSRDRDRQLDSGFLLRGSPLRW